MPEMVIKVDGRRAPRCLIPAFRLLLSRFYQNSPISPQVHD